MTDWSETLYTPSTTYLIITSAVFSNIMEGPLHVNIIKFFMCGMYYSIVYDSAVTRVHIDVMITSNRFFKFISEPW